MSLVAMRVRGSAVELRALLRRWSGFVLVVAAVLGPFFTTLIGWPALPLFWALEQSRGLGVLAIAGHALPGALLCWALREPLLPSRWLQAEASLPMPPALRRRADLAVLALAQAPWLLLNLISLLAWWHDRPNWLQGLWPGALTGFAASFLLSTSLGLLALRLHRQRQWQWPGRPVSGSSAPAGPQRVNAWTSANASPWLALLCLPLWRGPARPVLYGLGLGLALPLLSLALAWHWPQQASWALALFTLLVMGWSARLHSLAQRCFGPLREACQSLPLADAGWRWRLLLLALLPAWLAWAGLGLLLWLGPWALAPRATPVFVLWGLLAPALATGFAGGSAELRAGRWLLVWAVWVALASEVLL